MSLASSLLLKVPEMLLVVLSRNEDALLKKSPTKSLLLSSVTADVELMLLSRALTGCFRGTFFLFRCLSGNKNMHKRNLCVDTSK